MPGRMGPAGRGGARRRTRRRMNRRDDGTPEPAAAAPAPAPTASDPMEELTKLGELHKAGVLTDEEFSAKKAEILTKM